LPQASGNGVLFVPGTRPGNVPVDPACPVRPLPILITGGLVPPIGIAILPPVFDRCQWVR